MSMILKLCIVQCLVCGLVSGENDHAYADALEDSEISMREGLMLLEKRNYRDGLKSLENALEKNPKNVSAWYLLGEAYYQQQMLEQAQECWDKALKLSPNRTEIQERLTMLESEMTVEDKLQKTGSNYFEIRYEHDAEQYNIDDVQTLLQEARHSVGQDFEYYPKYKTVVILYPENDFAKIRQRPHWLAGMFDGKIRLALAKQIPKDLLYHLIFHEYTHVVVRDLTDSKCPVWLNEGLARYVEYRDTSYHFPVLRKALVRGELLPFDRFASLELDDTLQDDEVALFYDQAHSFVQFLIAKYHMRQIQKLCKRLGEGISWRQALKDQYHMEMDKLVVAWKRHLTSNFL